MRRSLFIFIGVLALSGCYNKEFNEPGRVKIDPQPTEVSVRAGFDRVWAATQKVFSRFPIDRSDSDDMSGRAFIVSDWIKGKSDVLYHGFDVTRVPYTIRYKLYVYVMSNAGAGTKVSIKNVEQYRDDFVTAGVDAEGSIYTWIGTDSSTLKEAKILEEIQKIATDPQFVP